jgi:farnesyl diphosphate synthase
MDARVMLVDSLTDAAGVSFDFNAWTAGHLQAVEAALSEWVPAQAPAGLGDAMRYAVLDGGKRLRPLLVMAAWESTAAGAVALSEQHQAAQNQRNEAALRAGDETALRESDEAALRAACAVELIHAYSLVHDDMPCMDNDILRRGKPTVHVKFGQAQALLAGDALQALAFELLTPQDGGVPAATQARLCALLARSAGEAGMAGGQAIDLASVGVQLSEDQLREMHRLKTGALLQASVVMGSACGSTTAQQLAGLNSYGAAIGLAFQVVDDILDVIADSATLGKTAGKDADNDKPTFVSLMGLERARAYAHTLYQQAIDALQASGLRDTRALHALADMVVQRSS